MTKSPNLGLEDQFVSSTDEAFIFHNVISFAGQSCNAQKTKLAIASYGYFVPFFQMQTAVFDTASVDKYLVCPEQLQAIAAGYAIDLCDHAVYPFRCHLYFSGFCVLCDLLRTFFCDGCTSHLFLSQT